MYIRKQAVGNDSGGEVAFQNQNECYMQQKSCGTRYVLSPDVTEEILMNKYNYGTVFHRHTHRCLKTVDSDGQEFLNYMFRYYLTEDHKCDTLSPDQQIASL